MRLTSHMSLQIATPENLPTGTVTLLCVHLFSETLLLKKLVEACAPDTPDTQIQEKGSRKVLQKNSLLKVKPMTHSAKHKEHSVFSDLIRRLRACVDDENQHFCSNFAFFGKSGPPRISSEDALGITAIMF